MEEKSLRLLKVEIPEHLEGEGGWSYKGKHWDNGTLRTASSDLEEFDLPLYGIAMDYNPWGLSNFTWILYHIRRIEKADLQYPIILNPDGLIIDGWHRIAKAVLQGDLTIKAKRLKVMPEVDSTYDD